MQCLYGYGQLTQCKRKEYPFCCFHKIPSTQEKYDCCICDSKQKKKKITLSICKHRMCLECFGKQVYEIQWFTGFNKTVPIFCPFCQNEVSDCDWDKVMDFLCELNIIQKDISFIDNVYNTYRIIYRKYKHLVEIDTSYRIKLHSEIEYIL